MKQPVDNNVVASEGQTCQAGEVQGVTADETMSDQTLLTGESDQDGLQPDGVGLGVDIVEIERIRVIIERTPSFTQRIFSEGERRYAQLKTRPEAQYAMRFAAKEAVLKALGIGFAKGVRPRDVEVGKKPSGKPFVILHGRAQEIADQLDVVDIPISLSYTHDEAVACAMAITRESSQTAKRGKDSMKELSRQFKELRNLLD